jgi:hypothetical protein
MQLLTLFLFLLLISLIIIASFGVIEGFDSNINLNLELGRNTIKKPRVFIPIYAPWKMYYPFELLQPYYNNIYQNMLPWY